MKIIICGSMSAHKEMSQAKQSLEQIGHIVDMPGLDNLNNELDAAGNTLESAHIKIEDNLIRLWFKKIQNADAVLAVNINKKGITGYIGANTFLELGFGYVLNKKIYVLNPYSKEIPYYDEINVLQPIILNGDLTKIEADY